MSAPHCNNPGCFECGIPAFNRLQSEHYSKYDRNIPAGPPTATVTIEYSDGTVASWEVEDEDIESEVEPMLNKYPVKL